jgi:hypothetical protein
LLLGIWGNLSVLGEVDETTLMAGGFVSVLLFFQPYTWDDDFNCQLFLEGVGVKTSQ